MYENFFGFREKPFKLVPNPSYLFLSQCHEEALAHLSYAVSQGDGFVAVTGEVGTGKTTLCRAFLESLDDRTEVAFIFNPKLDAGQLLRAINDEFGISGGGDNTKSLIDALNAFLLAQREKRKNVILLIDEAQNLDIDVLEQLRLVSNLETTKHKLIQIILVGQPELGELLDSHDLRQLGQRVALRTQLHPMTYRETRAYVQHRIRIASLGPAPVFAKGSHKRIYRYSGGVPRLINIVCERALIIAFGRNQSAVSNATVKEAVRELTAERRIRHAGQGRRVRWVAAGLLVCLTMAAMALFYRHRPPETTAGGDLSIPLRRKVPEMVPPAVQVAGAAEVLPEVAAVSRNPVYERADGESLEKILAGLTKPFSRQTALQTILDLWQPGMQIAPYLNDMEDSFAFFKQAARQNGLQVHGLDLDLDHIRVLNVPVVLEVFAPGAVSARYVALTEMTDDMLTLSAGEKVVKTEPEAIGRIWKGMTYIPWKNFLDLFGNFPMNRSKDAVMTLKVLLHDIGFRNIEIDSLYDAKTRSAVEMIQRKYRLEVDGIVGFQTKIALYKELKSFEMPEIVSQSIQ